MIETPLEEPVERTVIPVIRDNSRAIFDLKRSF